jgi:hypothetical protein
MSGSAALSEIEWISDGFSKIDHPHPDKRNRDEAATPLRMTNSRNSSDLL